MKRQTLSISLILLLGFSVLQAQTQARGPSTPEERAQAVRMARALESEPFGPDAKEQRRWIITWLIGVPDITVGVCSDLLGPVLESKRNYSTEIFGQMLPAEAAFIIENPDKAGDKLAVYAAGVEGALRAYESILKAKPKARWPYLDDLIAKREKGELSEYVRKTVAAHCSK